MHATTHAATNRQLQLGSRQALHLSTVQGTHTVDNRMSLPTALLLFTAPPDFFRAGGAASERV